MDIINIFTSTNDEELRKNFNEVWQKIVNLIINK